MKYIRVKNGVFAVNEEHGIKYIILAKDYLVKYFCDSRHIIAEADTIEELCDEFVAEELFVETNYIAHINKRVSVEKNLDYFVNYFIESNKVTKDKLLNVYGAIWTSKGLIYVAKLNDKGELELI